MTRGEHSAWIHLIPVGGIIALVLLVTGTDPTENVASILLVFLCVYCVMAYAVYSTLYYGAKLWSSLVPRHATAASISTVKRFYVASAIAFAPVCLLAMRSLNQLRLLDLALVCLLTGIVVFYITKRL